MDSKTKQPAVSNPLEQVVSNENFATVYIKSKDCDGDDMYYGVTNKFYEDNKTGYLNLFKRGSHKLSSKPDTDLFEIFDGEELTIEIGFSC